MDVLTDTIRQLLVWSRGELLLSGVLTLLLLGPGAVCCWIGYRVTGVRLAQGYGLLRRRRVGADRIEQRLESICTALTILTDSTEAGLRETISGLERLSGGSTIPSLPPIPIVQPAIPMGPVSVAGDERRTAREIAIAEGVSEGEVLLRLRLQGIKLQAAKPLGSRAA